MGVIGVFPKAMQQFAHLKTSVADLVAAGDDTAAVDYSSWYHKGKLSCCMAIMENRRDDAIEAMVKHASAQLSALENAGMRLIILVRDGADVPTKSDTDKDRAAERAEHRATMVELKMAMGDQPTYEQPGPT